MKVYIKNKIFSFGGGSSVVNENQEPVYKVKGRVFSVTKVNMFATWRIKDFLR